MSMITGMYIAFSLLVGFAMTMAWWSFRQRCQEELGQENKSLSYEADDARVKDEQQWTLRVSVQKNHPCSCQLRMTCSLLKDR